MRERSGKEDQKINAMETKVIGKNQGATAEEVIRKDVIKIRGRDWLRKAEDRTAWRPGSRNGHKPHRNSHLCPAVLYGCEIWTLKVRTQERLRSFENMVERRIVGPNVDPIT